MNLDATTEQSKEKRLCTMAGIGFSALMGGPLGACYLISKNFDVLGNKSLAKKSLFYGFLATVVIFGALGLIPTQILNKIPSNSSIIPMLYTAVISVYASKLQGPAIKKGLREGIKKYPKLKILGVSILSLVISIAFLCIVAACASR